MINLSSFVRFHALRTPKRTALIRDGGPDPVWGERPVVVLKPGHTHDLATLSAHCRAARDLQGPEGFILMDTFPRTPSGKVLKRELRRELAAARAP
jgi:fatty-acyl-CoA synthase